MWEWNEQGRGQDRSLLRFAVTGQKQGLAETWPLAQWLAVILGWPPPAPPTPARQCLQSCWDPSTFPPWTAKGTRAKPLPTPGMAVPPGPIDDFPFQAVCVRPSESPGAGAGRGASEMHAHHHRGWAFISALPFEVHTVPSLPGWGFQTGFWCRKVFHKQNLTRNANV